ncbi:uncharacterized protein LOC130054144 isoform X1 [Ostrea edulis]|uniref:uncharacterized protein LOC130054144 isoform X1 n=1 Tax=Ostrea edulis TaxID=37623 RepID=UPI0024AFD258|nr:uncharacterized protein LOC130054144 isoform X1 [Ostrea edulis]
MPWPREKFFDDDHDDLELPSLKVSKSLQSCRTETEEMKECRDDANMPGPSGFGKKSGKSVEQSAKMTTATSTMDVTSNVNLPMCPLKSSSERDDVQTSRMIKRPLEEDTVVPVKSPKTDKSKTCNEDESLRISDDFELPDIEVYPTPSEITDAKANSLSKEDRIEDSPIIDLEVKEFFDLMEMKIKRRKMAEDTVIAFPDKERKVITIIYEDHGGMSFTRPFCKDDTLQSIFTYICKEVEAEILPPVFHLECMAPLKCPTANCKHCWELDASHSLPISSLPDALIIKEGNFLMDDTITNYGNVLL